MTGDQLKKYNGNNSFHTEQFYRHMMNGPDGYRTYTTDNFDYEREVYELTNKLKACEQNIDNLRQELVNIETDLKNDPIKALQKLNIDVNMVLEKLAAYGKNSLREKVVEFKLK